MGIPRGEHTTAGLLRDAFRWFADGVEVRSAEANEPSLSAGASMVMSYLDDEPISPSALARRMQVSRQRVHVVIRELVAAGMVQLDKDPSSARDKLIRTTAAGRLRRLRVLDALRNREQRAERLLGNADIAQLRSLLVRLTASPADGASDAWRS